MLPVVGAAQAEAVLGLQPPLGAQHLEGQAVQPPARHGVRHAAQRRARQQPRWVLRQRLHHGAGYVHVHVVVLHGAPRQLVHHQLQRGRHRRGVAAALAGKRRHLQRDQLHPAAPGARPRGASARGVGACVGPAVPQHHQALRLPGGDEQKPLLVVVHPALPEHDGVLQSACAREVARRACHVQGGGAVVACRHARVSPVAQQLAHALGLAAPRGVVQRRPPLRAERVRVDRQQPRLELQQQPQDVGAPVERRQLQRRVAVGQRLV
mmetsp:Transcript_110924/g.314602  ORF Transcript_110924/g.314602 Transcript_110924/m.314602 type:complete len:266 (-) Transcript_110924:282-1079(-)